MNPTLVSSSLPTGRIGVQPPVALPATVRLGTVHLAVANLDRSLAFYEAVLGFRVLRRMPVADGRAARVELGAAGNPAALLILHEQPGARPVPPRGRLGLYHLAVLLPTRADLGRLLQHLRALGVPLGASDHAYSEALYLTDPDGITVEVYRDLPRSEWQLTTAGELRTALDPLDEAGVLQAAGAAPWQGLPAGTTLGHLHFYTGSLAQAAAFYHAALGFGVHTWSLRGALFVGAGGYHHHLGLNEWAAGSPVATEADARLLRWELWLPTAATRDAAAARLRAAGYPVEPTPEGPLATDPWGIRVLLRAETEAAAGG